MSDASTPNATAWDAGSVRVTLEVIAGPHAGRSFTFGEHDTFLFGRSPDAHFSLPEKDPYISRYHFMVEINPPLCRLIDVGSLNHTFLNGRRVKVADVNEGDQIKAGRTIFAVRFERPTAAEPEWPSEANQPKTPGPGMETPVDSDPCAGARLLDTRLSLPPFPTIAGYRIVRELGRGGMGVVYLAERDNEPPVALKTVSPAVRSSRETTERFLREARILEGLDHPNIVRLRDVGEASGLLYFAMDFVEGTDTGQLLQRDGPFTVDRAVRITCQVLEALAYAHGRGFVHRDVKPSNVMLTAGTIGVARLMDFGLARTYQASRLSGLTVSGTPGGTPAYMPPEQILNFREARPPADQYTSAATLYNLVTGAHVHGQCCSVEEMFMKILTDEPIPIRSVRPEVPEKLAAVIHRALAREPEARFESADAFRTALLPFQLI
jgi:serine/threonine-protein kinase